MVRGDFLTMHCADANLVVGVENRNQKNEKLIAFAPPAKNRLYSGQIPRVSSVVKDLDFLSAEILWGYALVLVQILPLLN
jgi:hypothetical protein